MCRLDPSREQLPLEQAGWRRPLFFGVCDFPKRLVRVDGSPQSAGRIARCRRIYPRQSLAEGKSLREIADAKKRPSAPARGSLLPPHGIARRFIVCSGWGVCPLTSMIWENIGRAER